MPSLFVVSDTNVVRAESWHEFTLTSARERGLSVRGLASYYVATELLAHLDDPDDPDLPFAVASLRRIWNRCKRTDGKHEILDLVADADAAMAKALFRVKPSSRHDEANLFGATLGELANVPKAQDLGPRSREVIRFIREHVDRVEEAFVHDLFDTVVLQVAPRATNWVEATRPGPVRDSVLAESASGRSVVRIGEAFATRAARTANVSLNDYELRDAGEVMQKAFPTPVHAYDILINEVVSKGLDMSAKAQRNSVWDLQIAFSTGVGAHIEGTPIWVVTGDNLILRAADRAKTRSRFVSPGEYKQTLELDYAAFDSAVQAS